MSDPVGTDVTRTSVHQRHRLAYERSGDGPAVVLIHALGGSGESWRRQIDWLSRDHTVVAVDLPGHGASPPAEPLRLGALASAIVEVIREEHLGAAVVVGHSLGGIVAAMVALEGGPALVSGLALVDTTLGPTHWPKEQLQALRTKLREDPRAALTHFFAPITRSEEQHRAIVEGALRVPVEALIALLDSAAEEGAGPRAGALRMPVWLAAAFLLEGRTTEQVIQEEGFGVIPNLTVERFDGSAHWPQLDEPDHFDSALARFIARCQAP